MPKIDTFVTASEYKDIETFFKPVIKKFARQTIKCTERWNEFPLIYKERALASILFPALENTNTYIFMEQPFKKKNQAQRFIDFFVDFDCPVSHKERKLLLIELKYERKAYNRTKLTNSILNKWMESLEQIKSITNSTTHQYVEKSKFHKIYKMSLIVLLVFAPTKNEKKFTSQTSKNFCNSIIENFNSKLKGFRKPNFFAVWKNTELTKSTIGNETYPFVCFVGRIERV